MINENHDLFKLINQDEMLKFSKLLPEFHKEIFSIIDEEHFTVLHKSCYSNKTDFAFQIINSLKQLDYSKEKISEFINLKTKNGYSALHFASLKGNYELLELLVENGAKINVISNEGLNVLHVASQIDMTVPIIYFYSKFNFDLNSQDFSLSTPLHWACYAGSNQVFELLLLFKSDLNIQDKQGNTPLHYAAFYGRLKYVKKLIHRGANPYIKNNEGKTMLEFPKEEMQKNLKLFINQSKNYCSASTPFQQLTSNYMKSIIFIISNITVDSLIFVFDYHSNKIGFFIALVILLFGNLFLFLYLMFNKHDLLINRDNLSIEYLLINKLKLKDYCLKCLVKKTANSKHCFICERCVDCFDHHCFWVNNCVTSYTKKVFFVFLVWNIFHNFYRISLVIYKITLLTPRKDDNGWPGQSNLVNFSINLVVFLVSFFAILPILTNLYLNLKIMIQRNKMKKNDLIQKSTSDFNESFSTNSSNIEI